MKLEEERIAKEKKLSELISKLPSGILVTFDGTDHYKLTDEIYEQVCKVTKLIPQRAIMAAHFLNYEAYELYTINGNKIDETYVKWDKDKNKCFAGYTVSGNNRTKSKAEKWIKERSAFAAAFAAAPTIFPAIPFPNTFSRTSRGMTSPSPPRASDLARSISVRVVDSANGFKRLSAASGPSSVLSFVSSSRRPARATTRDARRRARDDDEDDDDDEDVARESVRSVDMRDGRGMMTTRAHSFASFIHSMPRAFVARALVARRASRRAMEVLQFPARRDNYGFAVRCPETNVVALVDAPSASAIERAIERADWPSPSVVLNTHWHEDHVGANDALRERWPELRVHAPAREREKIGRVDVGVREGDVVRVGALRCVVRETPGHTLGHVVYHFEGEEKVFVGDVMFAMGCGRLFEGTAEEMWTSMGKLLAMPDETTVYCAHEYTESNAMFALSVNPSNEDLVKRAECVREARARGDPTVPTTIALERRTNPFCRPDDEEIQRNVGMVGSTDLASVLGAIRKAKDNF